MKTILVTAAIIERDGRVLIARRREGDHLAGKWEFPGGKVEPGETPEGCLARELEEEFGVRTRVGEFVVSSVHDYGDKKIELLAYRVEAPAPAAREASTGEWRLHAHDRIEWVTPEEMNGYDFAQADLPIVARLQREP